MISAETGASRTARGASFGAAAAHIARIDRIEPQPRLCRARCRIGGRAHDKICGLSSEREHGVGCSLNAAGGLPRKVERAGKKQPRAVELLVHDRDLAVVQGDALELAEGGEQSRAVAGRLSARSGRRLAEIEADAAVSRTMQAQAEALRLDRLQPDLGV